MHGGFYCGDRPGVTTLGTDGVQIQREELARVGAEDAHVAARGWRIISVVQPITVK
jgi:hypothetical protein